MAYWIAPTLFVAWLVWTYFVYQVGYHNASKDAEEIAGRQLWVRQEQETRCNFDEDYS